MLDQGMITSSQKDEAVAEPIELHAFTSRERYPYPYFVDYFKQWFLSNPAFGKTREDRYQLLFTGGLRITTTIDPQFQRFAQSAVRSVLPYPGDPVGRDDRDRPPHRLRPRDGGRERRRLLGRELRRRPREPRDGRQHRATGGLVVQAVRAGGGARERHLAEHGVLRARPRSRSRSTTARCGMSRTPSRSSYGSLTLEQATISSVNTVYAQLINELGAQTVVDVAKRMGIRCCQRVSEPKTSAAPVPLGRARDERGQHPRDDAPRTGRSRPAAST